MLYICVICDAPLFYEVLMYSGSLQDPKIKKRDLWDREPDHNSFFYYYHFILFYFLLMNLSQPYWFYHSWGHRPYTQHINCILHLQADCFSISMLYPFFESICSSVFYYVLWKQGPWLSHARGEREFVYFWAC